MVKECVHIDTGRYYAAKVINKRLMAGREHMVHFIPRHIKPGLELIHSLGPQRNRYPKARIYGPPKYPHFSGLLRDLK